MALDDRFVGKFHPRRAPQMSGLMVALLEYLLDQERTTTSESGRGLGHIVSLATTSDGILLANNGNEHIGPLSDFQRNLDSWLDATGATADERATWQAILDSKIEVAPGCRRVVLS